MIVCMICHSFIHVINRNACHQLFKVTNWSKFINARIKDHSNIEDELQLEEKWVIRLEYLVYDFGEVRYFRPVFPYSYINIIIQHLHSRTS